MERHVRRADAVLGLVRARQGRVHLHEVDDLARVRADVRARVGGVEEQVHPQHARVRARVPQPRDATPRHRRARPRVAARDLQLRRVEQARDLRAVLGLQERLLARRRARRGLGRCHQNTSDPRRHARRSVSSSSRSSTIRRTASRNSGCVVLGQPGPRRDVQPVDALVDARVVELGEAGTPRVVDAHVRVPLVVEAPHHVRRAGRSAEGQGWRCRARPGRRARPRSPTTAPADRRGTATGARPCAAAGRSTTTAAAAGSPRSPEPAVAPRSVPRATGPRLRAPGSTACALRVPTSTCARPHPAGGPTVGAPGVPTPARPIAGPPAMRSVATSAARDGAATPSPPGRGPRAEPTPGTPVACGDRLAVAPASAVAVPSELDGPAPVVRRSGAAGTPSRRCAAPWRARSRGRPGGRVRRPGGRRPHPAADRRRRREDRRPRGRRPAGSGDDGRRHEAQRMARARRCSRCCSPPATPLAVSPGSTAAWRADGGSPGLRVPALDGFGRCCVVPVADGLAGLRVPRPTGSPGLREPPPTGSPGCACRRPTGSPGLACRRRRARRAPRAGRRPVRRRVRGRGTRGRCVAAPVVTDGRRPRTTGPPGARRPPRCPGRTPTDACGDDPHGGDRSRAAAPPRRVRSRGRRSTSRPRPPTRRSPVGARRPPVPCATPRMTDGPPCAVATG